MIESFEFNKHYNTINKKAMACYEDLQFLRHFKVALNTLMEKQNKTVLSKKEIDGVYESIMRVIRQKTKDQLPELSEPEVIGFTHEGQEYYVNKATKIIFNKLNDEYIAFGKALDDIILKLTISDVVLIAANGWRFHEDRCVSNPMLFASSAYSVRT
jgi:hypothetical protein